MATAVPQPLSNAKSAVEETSDDELDPTPGESYTGRILTITPYERHSHRQTVGEEVEVRFCSPVL